MKIIRIIVMSENLNYFAFNREAPESVIRLFQQALDSIREEHLEILKKYGVSL